MRDVLLTTKFVVENSEDVEIEGQAIHELVSGIDERNLETGKLNLSKYKWGLKNILQIIFVFNALNFCYWAKKGEEKWTVNFADGSLDGAVALFRCLEEEIRKNPDFLSGDELADLSNSRLRRILKDNVQIPLFEERLKCVNEVGVVLERKFKNSFLHLFEQADNDALKLVDLLMSNFPSFNDTSTHKGKTIAFYKRAQLNSKMINDTLQKFGGNPLKNLGMLTAFADYKIPQKLRSLGVLKYSEKLANKIDNHELIEAHSKEEVEIRANMIWAVEKIRAKLAKRFPFVTASHVDSMLWNLSQVKKGGEKPYHRTLTIAY